MKTKHLGCLLAVLFVLVSCSGQAPELMEFLSTETSGDYDFEGYKYYFYHENIPGAVEELIIYTYDKNTVQGEALLNRVNEIKTKYNAEVIFNQQLNDSQFQMQSMSGVLQADACCFTYLNAMQLFAKNGLLYPITDFSSQIDLSEADKYGDANILEPGMYESVPYVVCPLYWPGYQALDSFILVYNTDLLYPNGITEFHEFYENGTWTWKTFENEFLAKFRVPNNDGGYVPAFAAGYGPLFDMLMYSNGTEFITRNAEGNNVVNLYPQEFVTAYQQGLEWCRDYADVLDVKDGSLYMGYYLLGEAGATLSTAEHVTVGAVAYNPNEFNYHIMPFPCGPDATYGEWAQFVQRAQGFGIPKSSKDPEIAAQILSLLLDPFEELGGEAGLYDFYESMTFPDATDANIFFELMEYTRYDYTFWDKADVGRSMASSFGTAMNQGKSAAEVYDMYKNKIEYMVVECMLPNFDYMYDNYYSLRD